MPTINAINEATSTINQIEILTQAIKHLFSTPENYAIAILIALWFFLNKNFLHVIQLFGKRDKKRIEELDNFISRSKNTEKTLLLTIHDIRNSLYFKIATGINAEKKYRELLINLHNHTSHKITWKIIQRASPFIDINQNNEISIRPFSKFEIFTMWYNILAGTFLILASIFFFGASFLAVKTALSFAAIYLTMAILFLITAAIAFAQNWPEEAARKIESELKLNPISAKGIEGYKAHSSE